MNVEQILVWLPVSTVGPAELDDLLDAPVVVVLVGYSGCHIAVAEM